MDYVDEKIGYSGYTETMRKFLLQDNGDKYPEEVFLAGLDLGCCVLETATDFFEAGGAALRPHRLLQLRRWAGVF